MSKRATAGIVVALVAVFGILLGCIVGVPILLALGKSAEAASCVAGPVAGAPVPPGTAFDKWDARQVANAAVIVSVGKQMNVNPWAYAVALGTAMQESNLLNHANDNPDYPEVVRISMALPHEAVGNNYDSVGLFQQRADEGEAAQHGRKAWGPVKDLMTPNISARKFYDKLLTIPGWETMRLTDAAQAVQHSGTPEAYQKHEADAKALAAHVLGLPNIDIIGGGGPQAPCGAGQFGPVPVGPNGWVRPVDKQFVVGPPFGEDRGDHRHAGVDIVGANIRNQPIRAAADGVVVRVTCNSGNGDCDHDGAPGLGGCGWYVDISHPGNVATRYCHQIRQPLVQQGQSVTAGQVIGFVGSSGNSSGPHLHFEVHVNVPGGADLAFSNAVDPVPFMAAQQAPLS